MKHLGLAELAQALGISTNLAKQWQRRGKLPPPDDRVAAGPIWHQRTVDRWLEARKA